MLIWIREFWKKIIKHIRHAYHAYRSNGDAHSITSSAVIDQSARFTKIICLSIVGAKIHTYTTYIFEVVPFRPMTQPDPLKTKILDLSQAMGVHLVGHSYPKAC